ncbi:MAG: cell wall metabolism sensor histidine kinase WalK [Chloroflexaceae bacterium]|nr:cell wall metabolism sensor histidine kinase WalK [Chloroflexaceae bacterium]
MTLLEVILFMALLASLGGMVWQRRVMQRAANGRQPDQPPTGEVRPPSAPDGLPGDQKPMNLSPLFRVVASSVNVGIVIVNGSRNVHFLNRQAEDLLDIDRGTAEDQGMMTLVRDYQVDTLVAEVLHDGEEREITISPVVRGRTLHLRCVPLIPNGKTSGALLIIQDVTQINILERARRDLVANVSHELRTPLASLKLLVETVQSNPPPDVSHRMLEQMAWEVDMVTQLVEELHELSQIESGRVTLKLSSGNIDAVIRKAFERIRPQADRKHIQVERFVSDDIPLALMDEHRVGQILLNLLHNAVKFTPDGGAIMVQSCVVAVDEQTPQRSPSPARAPAVASAFHQERLLVPAVRQRRPGEYVVEEGQQVVIMLPASHPPGLWVVTSITDTGMGIPSEDLPRIFERFYKVDRSRNRESGTSTAGGTGGTGLGLAITRHLVEGHGGRVWAESAEGRGSAFYFTLPVA